jgi:hypothetical protein
LGESSGAGRDSLLGEQDFAVNEGRMPGWRAILQETTHGQDISFMGMEVDTAFRI